MDIERLDAITKFPGLVRALELEHGFNQAEPFPHLCIDNCIHESLLTKVRDEFPAPRARSWNNEDDGGPAHKKWAQTDVYNGFGPYTRYLIAQLHAGSIIDILERLTGMERLVPDPHLYGGGLHQVRSGGYLKIHGDFLTHPRLALRRRLNLILYLNEDWLPEYQGDLELWDANMSRCVKRYSPTWNRAVLFSVQERGYHGHPDPVTCPEEIVRKSISIFYYSQEPGEQRDMPRAVSEWRRRPAERRFRPAGALRALLPPILFDLRNHPRFVAARFTPPLIAEAAMSLNDRWMRYRRKDGS